MWLLPSGSDSAIAEESFMKSARFDHEGTPSFGIVKDEETIKLNGSLFDTYQETRIHYPLYDVKLLPPAVPTKIVCVAHNYRGLIEEIDEEFPDEPVFFLKPPSCLIGHEGATIYPPVAHRRQPKRPGVEDIPERPSDTA